MLVGAVAAESAQADKPSTYVDNEHSGGGLQNAVVQVNLTPTILSFTKHLWLQPLMPIKMPVSLSERMRTKNISH